MHDPPPSDSPEETPAPQPVDPAKAARFREIVNSILRGTAGTNAEQLEAAVSEVGDTFAQCVEDHPLPEDDPSERIAAAEARYDWEEVLRLRRDWIASQRRTQSDKTGTCWLALTRQSALLRILGETEEAMQMAEEAVADAGREGLWASVVRTAENAARCALALGQPDHALHCLDQAAAAMQSIIAECQGPGGVHLIEASYELARAQCHLARGDLPAAEADVAAARTKFERLADAESMTGIQSRIAECWEVAGLIHRTKGEWQDAREWLLKTIQHRLRIVARDDSQRHVGIHRLAGTLEQYAQVLQASGSVDEAASVRHDIRELCASVRLPPPPAGS